MKKQLPTLSIKGDSIQQLIELEMILVMLGYDKPDEGHNNIVVIDDYKDAQLPFIKICGKTVTYFSMVKPTYLVEAEFHASDVSGIINYVENYKSAQK